MIGKAGTSVVLILIFFGNNSISTQSSQKTLKLLHVLYTFLFVCIYLDIRCYPKVTFNQKVKENRLFQTVLLPILSTKF